MPIKKLFRHLLSFLAFLVLCSCASKEKFEINSKNIVIYNSARGPYVVSGADPATFKYIGGAFGSDKEHVYFGEKVVEVADLNSFSAIDSYTGRDANSIYRGNEKCKECDINSFRRLSDQWYVDKYASYSEYGDKWKRYPDIHIDANSFKEINFWYSKDNKNVYFSDHVIIGADAASFKLASFGICEVCAEDKNKCYVDDHAMPCDFKTQPDFPSNMLRIPLGKSFFDLSRLNIGIDAVDGVSRPPNNPWVYVDSGTHNLDLSCPTKNKNFLSGKLVVDIKPGRIYKLDRHEGVGCSANLMEFTMVRGKIINPEISIQYPDKYEQSGYKWTLEATLHPGSNNITAVCREANRERMRESKFELTVNLIEGHLYHLDGKFTGVGDQCEVQLIDDGS